MEPGAAAYICAVCLDEAKAPVVVKCGHLYCAACLEKWLARKPSCPKCNYSIDHDEDVIPIFTGTSNATGAKKFPPKFKRPDPNAVGQTRRCPPTSVNTVFTVGIFPFCVSFNVSQGISYEMTALILFIFVSLTVAAHILTFRG